MASDIEIKQIAKLATTDEKMPAKFETCKSDVLFTEQEANVQISDSNPHLVTFGHRTDLVDFNREVTLFVGQVGLGKAYVPTISEKVPLGTTEE